MYGVGWELVQQLDVTQQHGWVPSTKQVLATTREYEKHVTQVTETRKGKHGSVAADVA